MKFAEPEWLYLLIIPLLLMPLLAAVGNRKRKKILSKLSGSAPGTESAVHLSPVRRFWRLLLLMGAAVFLIVGAAKPYIYSRLLPFEPKGRDLLILCDVSRSMNSTDIAPSRLRHARFIMHQLAERAKGDRLGLAAFAGNAYLSCPLTSDPVTFKEYVDELSTETVPAGGTNLEKALRVAEKAFAGSESSNRAIILLTDGEEVQGNTLAAAAELKKKKIPVFAVGFGDPVNGAVIPVQEGKSALVRDSSGKIVTSKLNEKILSRLAQETGGIYVRTTVTDPGLAQLGSAIANLNPAGHTQVKRQIPVEEFTKFFGGALAVLVIFLLLSERGNLRKNTFLLLLCFLISGAGTPPEKNGLSAQTPPAIPEPEEPEALYNLALKLQKEKDPRYRELYSKLLAKVPVDSPVAVRSFHNLGAGRHQECRQTFDNSRKQLAAQQLDQALQTLENAEKLAGAAEELYGRSVTNSRQLPAPLSANLTRLDRERKAIQELKKRIEELKKQQQQAQNKTRQAQQKNQSAPSSPQQRREQQQEIDQARRESEKLQQQAQQMEQKELSDSARKAADELKKASQAKADKQDRKAEEHLKNAVQALAGKESPSSGKEKDPGKKEEKQQPQKQPASGTPEQQKQQLNGKESAEQLLELMGEEDKKLREAMKQRRNMRRVKVEKDW